MTKSDSKRYHAFISYRHADNKEQGRQWATWMHQAIETYQVPTDLVGKTNARGEKIQSRIFPIFRDEEELPAHADLGKSIVSALDSTRLLIVLCSPRAYQSTYVADEIDYFKSQGHSDRIIAAMIDGEPNTSWDTSKLKLGFTAEDECFPIPLQFEYDESGKRTDKHAEPIAADFRINNNGTPEQAWTSLEAYRQDLKNNQKLSKAEIDNLVSSYQSQQHLMLLKIIAGILGVPLGELTQRDKEYQLEQAQIKAKKLRRWLFAVSLLTIAAVIASFFAWNQRQEAIAQRHEALSQRNEAMANQSNYLTVEAEKRVGTPENDLALLLALNAMPGTYGGARPAPDNQATLYRATMEASKVATFQHDETVNKSIFSPDGTQVITTSNDETAVLWSVGTGNKIKEYNLFHVVERVEYSQNGEVFALSAMASKYVILYDSHTGEKLHWLDQGRRAYVNKMSFSPNSEMIAVSYSVYGSQYITVWNVSSGEKIKTFEQEQAIYSIAFSNDSSRIVSASFGGEISMWTIDDGINLFTFQIGDTLRSISYSNNDKTFATMSNKQAVQIWSAQDGRLLASTELQERKHGFPKYNLTYSPDDQSILAVHGDNWADLISTTNGKLIHRFEHLDEVTHAAFNPQGDAIVTSSHDKNIVIWSTVTGKERLRFSHADKVLHAEFSPDGRSIISSSRDKTASLWRMQGQYTGLLDNYPSNIKYLSTDNKNNRYLIASENGNFELRNLDNNTKLESFSQADKNEAIGLCENKNLLFAARTVDMTRVFSSNHTDERRSINNKNITMSPDCTTYAIAKNSYSIDVFDVASNKRLSTLTHKQNYRVNKIKFSHDSKYLATYSIDWDARMVYEDRIENINSEVTIWSVHNGDPLDVIDIDSGGSSEVMAIEFSPNDKIILIKKFVGSHRIHHGEVTLYSIENGDMILDSRYQDSSTVKNTTFSPDSHNLVTTISFVNDEGHRVNDMFIDSITEDKPLARLKHQSSHHSPEISTDGKLMAITDDNRTIIIWSLGNFSPIASYQTKQDINQLFFSNDGDKLIVISKDNIYHLPIIAAEKLTETAINKLPFNRTCLTAKEREKFFLSPLSDEQKLQRGCPDPVTEE
ncbi:MAG: TIR domain-containing protein [Kangiellaceae bacterium]|nr:TIR domain-containing protein [Kangiellaceae bacterium]